VSYSVWLDFDKPITSLAYPGTNKIPKTFKPLGNLPGVFYEVGEMSSRPLMFPTKSEAEKVANLIPKAIVQKEENL
jgi:hypothetical protein